MSGLCGKTDEYHYEYVEFVEIMGYPMGGDQKELIKMISTEISWPGIWSQASSMYEKWNC